jgi:hypothetical protein
MGLAKAWALRCFGVLQFMEIPGPIYWHFANIGYTVPPRDPDDDDESEDEEDDDREEDLDPTVIREPDE